MQQEEQEFLKQCFVEEANDLLTDVERCLLSIEGDVIPDSAVEQLFRMAHNLKGSARSIGYVKFAKFIHCYEDLLSGIKKGIIEKNYKINDLLFFGFDKFKELLQECIEEDFEKASINDFLEEVQGLQEMELIEKNKVTHNKESREKEAEETNDSGIIFNEEALAEHKSNESDSGIIFNEELLQEHKKNNIQSEVIEENSPPKNTQKTKQQASSIRVQTKKLDHLIDHIGELVILQTMIEKHAFEGTLQSESSLQTMGLLSKLIKDIKESSVSLRMTPISPLFQRLKRAARDAGKALGKEIELKTIGDDVEIDKSVLEKLADPLSHIIRNAVDHGLESNAERVTQGKKESGTVTICAKQEDDKVNISVSDDGKGLNKEKIKKKAIEQGIISPTEVLSDNEVYNLIFKAGFSTAEKVTNISGRGVGMDVLVRTINDLRGNIQLTSAEGKGTTFSITLPLSLSIISGMIVQVDGIDYVVPISQLSECVDLNSYKISTVTNKGKVLDLRGEVIPILSLSERLRTVQNKKNCLNEKPHGFGLICFDGEEKVVFEVEKIVSQQQIVLKKLGKEMNSLPGVMGGAVLSNGEPGLVLNLLEYNKFYKIENRRA